MESIPSGTERIKDWCLPEKMSDGAVIVNPYDTAKVAAEIKSVLEMKEDEKKRRMDMLSETVKERNIYWWLENYLKEWFGSYGQQALI